MKLIIEIKDSNYQWIKEHRGKVLVITQNLYESVREGTPLEEIPNPCIECSQNCCVCELNGEKCECQKVYVVKESKE